MRVLPLPGAEWRFAPMAIFAIAVLIVLSGVGIILQNEVAYRETRNQQTIGQAQILAASVAAPIDFGDVAAAQESVEAFRANPQVRWIGVFGRDRQLVAGFSKTGEPLPRSEQTIPAEAEGVRVQVPVSAAGQRVGSVSFEVESEPLSRRLTRYGVLGMLVLLAALVVIVLGLAQTALRRANRQLAERAEALAQANVLLEEQIGERAKAEDQLRQSQKMQALGQLTGGIAHDFNNLLTVIQGSADMLSRDKLPDDKRRRFAKAIVQASGNAAALTAQLLAFARRQPLKPERLDVNALIHEMRDLIDRTVGERIELVVDVTDNGCAVEVDRAQLQSAILNIASNARDAMPDGGRLTIATRLLEAESGVAMIAVEVSDTGTGMDAATLDRMFEPFFTTKKTGEGTGLGLSQVYGFASQSGGEVQCRSAPGEGTTVSVLLPCSSAPAASIAPTIDLVSEQRPADILVVEDNEEVGAFAETLLAELGHAITRARSGEEALDLARARHFDLVFSDVVMPGMGGLKLAEALSVERPGLPVVLATGYSQEIAQSGSGGRPVILKPYRLATLAEAISAALQQPAAN